MYVHRASAAGYGVAGTYGYARKPVNIHHKACGVLTPIGTGAYKRIIYRAIRSIVHGSGSVVSVRIKISAVGIAPVVRAV